MTNLHEYNKYNRIQLFIKRVNHFNVYSFDVIIQIDTKKQMHRINTFHMGQETMFFKRRILFCLFGIICEQISPIAVKH